MSYHYHKNKDPRFKAVVTFWPGHRPYHEIMWPDTPVHCVQPSVDLEAWTPDGPRGYGFHGKKGTCNVVVTDAWRMDIDPFPVVNAFAIYARKFKGAKLHVYGCSKDLKGWGALFKSIQDQGNLGEVKPWVGRPPHEPTKETRALVEAMSGRSTSNAWLRPPAPPSGTTPSIPARGTPESFIAG